MIRKGEETRRRERFEYLAAADPRRFFTRSCVAVRRVYWPTRHSISRCHHVDATLRFSGGFAHYPDGSRLGSSCNIPSGLRGRGLAPVDFWARHGPDHGCTQANMTKGERRRSTRCRVSWTSAIARIANL